MTITPLAIRKMQFPQKMRGLDPQEVEEFLNLVADELAESLRRLDDQQRRNHALKKRLREVQERERSLQDTLLKAQRLSDEIVGNAQKEAQLIVREAELTADKVVQQALDQVAIVDKKTVELRQKRKELHLKFRNTLDLFTSILEADREDEKKVATVHQLRAKILPKAADNP